jgi:hypothetical protein
MAWALKVAVISTSRIFIFAEGWLIQHKRRREHMLGKGTIQHDQGGEHELTCTRRTDSTATVRRTSTFLKGKIMVVHFQIPGA